MAIWRRNPSAQITTQQTANNQPPSSADLNQHSFVGAHGGHLLVSPHTGSMPWFGHKNSIPQQHPFSPSGTFNPYAGGALAAASGPGYPITTQAAMNQQAGSAKVPYARIQMAPGGGRA